MWQAETLAEDRVADRSGIDAGDRFDALMRRYERPVLGTAYRLLGNLADAQDVAQEVFFRLYKNHQSLDPERDAGPWLYRVTVNACHDLRRRKPEEALEEIAEPSGDDGGDWDGEIDLQTRREIVRQALRQLPEKERTALVLRDIEGLATADVAAAMGSAEGTVRSQVSTARARLRKICEGLLRRRVRP